MDFETTAHPASNVLNQSMGPQHDFTFPVNEGGPIWVGFDQTSGKPPDPLLTKPSPTALASSRNSFSPNPEGEGGGNGLDAQQSSAEDADLQMDEDV